jgi:hypothetical protein
MHYAPSFLSIALDSCPNVTFPTIQAVDGGSTEVTPVSVFKRGFHCDKCKRVSCQYKWHQWECRSCRVGRSPFYRLPATDGASAFRISNRTNPKYRKSIIWASSAQNPSLRHRFSHQSVACHVSFALSHSSIIFSAAAFKGERFHEGLTIRSFELQVPDGLCVLSCFRASPHSCDPY